MINDNHTHNKRKLFADTLDTIQLNIPQFYSNPMSTPLSNVPHAPTTRPKHTFIEPDPILLPPSPTTHTRALNTPAHSNTHSSVPHRRRTLLSRDMKLSPSTYQQSNVLDSSGDELTAQSSASSDDDELNYLQHKPKRHMSISSNQSSASQVYNKPDLDADLDLLSRSPTVLQSMISSVPQHSSQQSHSNRAATERLHSRRIAQPSTLYTNRTTLHRSSDGSEQQNNNGNSNNNSTTSTADVDDLQFKFDDLQPDFNTNQHSPIVPKYIPSSRATQSNT